MAECIVSATFLEEQVQQGWSLAEVNAKYCILTAVNKYKRAKYKFICNLLKKNDTPCQYICKEKRRIEDHIGSLIHNTRNSTRTKNTGLNRQSFLNSCNFEQLAEDYHH